MQRFAVVVTAIFLALLLLDVAPCGNCSNQRPVDHDEQTEPTREDGATAKPATPSEEAPSPANAPTE